MLTRVAIALAAALALGGASPPRPLHDEAALLYATQLTFSSDGVPTISVGLMDGQERVSVEAPGGLVVHLSGPAHATLRVPGAVPLEAHVEDGVPGQTRYRVVLDSARGGDLDALREARARWKERGLAVAVVELGGVVGFPRRVLDNRRTLVVEDNVFPTRAKAEARARVLTRRFELPEELTAFGQPVEHARGTVVAQLGGGVGALAGLTLRQSSLLRLTAADGGPITVRRVEYGRGYAHHGFADRAYHGEIILAVDRDAHLAAVNRVSAEAVLRGLVPSEIFPTAPASALQAQAISARGELLAKVGVRHLADPYLVCASQHCQVYSGTSRETAATDRAVRSTRGEMLFDTSDHLVDSVYSASCGGHSESNENVWEGVARASLRGRFDGPGRRRPWPKGAAPTDAQLKDFLEHPPPTYCGMSKRGAKVFRWGRVFEDAELDRRANERYDVGHVTAIEVLERGVSGRVIRVRFRGVRGEAVVRGELNVRRLLGNLRSGMFVVHHDETSGQWVFQGGGWGHGVGMCQHGAIGMASRGKSAADILRHYFAGSRVEKLY